jgi:nicotinamidase-related amidase
MSNRIDKETLLAMLLQRTPDRVLDAMLAVSPEDRAALTELRSSLAVAALAAPPVTPSKSLRDRLLASKPRPRRPERPVVVVLDMIQDHLTPGRPLEVPRAREIVPALKDHLVEWRKQDMPIIYACDAHAPGDPDFMEWPEHALEGSGGGDVWPEIAPHNGDHVLHKRTYSAFMGSNLQSLLDELAADKIILTGCLTEIGMQVTAADALQRGYVVDLPGDCQAGSSAPMEMATLLTLSTMPPYDPLYLRKRG